MTKTKLTAREINIILHMFIESTHFSAMAMASDKNRTPYQNELFVLFEKLNELDKYKK